MACDGLPMNMMGDIWLGAKEDKDVEFMIRLPCEGDQKLIRTPALPDRPLWP